MERLKTVQTAQPSAEVASLAPFPQVGHLEAGPELEQLAIAARNTPGSASKAAMVALHSALRALSPTEANAKALVRLLDDGALAELRGDDGPTRELAIETLLRLGYPWALQLHPDELAWYRRTQGLQRRAKWLWLLGVLAIGAVAQAFLLRLF